MLLNPALAVQCCILCSLNRRQQQCQLIIHIAACGIEVCVWLLLLLLTLLVQYVAGLCNDTVSVCRSVCPFLHRRCGVRRVCCCGPRDIDRLLHGASAAGAACCDVLSTSTAARPSAVNAGSVTFTVNTNLLILLSSLLLLG